MIAVTTGIMLAKIDVLAIPKDLTEEVKNMKASVEAKNARLNNDITALVDGLVIKKSLKSKIKNNGKNISAPRIF